jgi:hypothetical protein
MDLLATYNMLEIWTKNYITGERAKGIPLTQCPNCGRVVLEGEIVKVGGVSMCMGRPKEAYCLESN